MKGALVFDEPAGRIVIPESTLAAIVSTAVERAGARVRRRPRRSLAFEIDGRSMRVEVGLVAPGEVVLNELAARVQERVKEALETSCELERVSIDVTIEELA